MDINYEFVSWNATSIREEISNGLSEAQFIERGIKEGQYKNFSQPDQVTLFKEVFKLINESKPVGI